MLNYREIRAELLKRYEMDVTVKFYAANDVAYIFLTDFCVVRLPPVQNPYSAAGWEAVPGLAFLSTDLDKLTRGKPVNRLITGPDDLYHLVRADDRSLEAWYPQTLFGLLDAKEDYDWRVDPETKYLYVTSEPMRQLEIICAPAGVEDEK